MMRARAAILKTAIARDLECLSEESLDKVRAHIADLAAAAGRPNSGRKSLAGIWQGTGFERIPDLEQEIEFRELHDRLILATAKWFEVPVLSSDREFRQLKGIEVIWD